MNMKPPNDFIRRLTVAAAGAFLTFSCFAQSTPAPGTTVADAKSSIPRLPDGHPDFQGTWYKNAGYQPNGSTLLPGGGRGAGGPGGTSTSAFGRSTAENADVFLLHGAKIPYRPEAVLE